MSNALNVLSGLPLLMLTLMLMNSLHAGDVIQEPGQQVVTAASLPCVWIPKALDDWPKLVSEAKTFVQNNSTDPYNCRLVEQVQRYFDNDIPYPPKLIDPMSVITVSYIVSKGTDNKRHGASFGQAVVWRGDDGKAMAATVIVQVVHLTSFDATLLADPAAFRQSLTTNFTSAKPPIDRWKVVSNPERGFWYATWSRPDSRVATMDTRLGKAPPLRRTDLDWLTGPPGQLTAVIAPEMLSDAAFAIASAQHPQVRRALACAAAGIPMHAVGVSGLMPKGAAEQLDWRVGDIVLALNDEPMPFDRILAYRCKTLSDVPRRFRLTRLNSIPIESVVEPVTDPRSSNLVGFEMSNLPCDPGLALLASLAEADPEIRREAATAIYAQDQPRLAATARKRLSGRISVEAGRFIEAWSAAESGDPGRVAELLAAPMVDSRLADAAQHLEAATRNRAGRLLWMRPDFIADSNGETLLRHLLATTPESERFLLFNTGQTPEPCTFPVDGIAEGVNDAGRQLLERGSSTLRCSEQQAQQDAQFTDLPDRCEYAVHFTLASTAYDNDHGSVFASPLDHSLTIGFQRRGSSITPAGFGGVRIHDNGMVQIADPSLNPNKYYEWWTIPLGVAVDGVTTNTLRIVRWRQMQRIEINGRCAMQGFLPFVDSIDGKARLAMMFDAHGVVVELSDGKFRMPVPTVTAAPTKALPVPTPDPGADKSNF